MPSCSPASPADRTPARAFSCQRLALPLALGLSLALAACGGKDGGPAPGPDAESAAEDAAQRIEATAESAAEAIDTAMAGAGGAMMAGAGALAEVLSAQPDEVRARYAQRHPAETLTFFGVEPGMTVLEALPGGGWYTKILVPYLGTGGTLVGVDYDKAMFPLFGFYDDATIAAKETWPEDWSAKARGWFDGGVASIDAYQFGAMPAAADESLDAALFIRALHNLARFEGEGGYLSTAIAETYAALKPGGILGVVQHMAPEDAPDEWANGSAGYLKKSFVISAITGAGFEFVDESDVNVNPKDQPTTDDVVWRLPPTLSGAKDNPGLADERRAIGESTRMTLLFRKPA